MHSLWRSPVLIAALSMAVLPFALLAGGLTMTSATDVVIFAIACMALNILVGHTGLVSFGHGAWFGLGAYAAALTQTSLVPGLDAVADAVRARVPAASPSIARRLPRPAPARRLLLAADAGVLGAHLRGRVSLDGVHRRRERPGRRRRARPGSASISRTAGSTTRSSRCSGWPWSTRFRRFHASPIGTVLVAIRENEQRAQFIGYADASLQADRLRAVGRADRLRRRAVRVPSSLRLGRPDVGRRSRASCWRW